MGKFYVGYENSYSDPTSKIVLHFPDFLPTTESVPYRADDITSATQNYPNVFDNTYTIFTASQTMCDNLTSQGFTNVLLVNSEKNYYLSETKRLKFYMVTTTRVGVRLYENDTLILGLGSTNNNEGRTLTTVGNLENVQVQPTADYLDIVSTSATRFGWLTQSDTLENYNKFINFMSDIPAYQEDTDPYVGGGGSSGGGGGTGDFDNTSDTIGLPSLPSLSGLNTGFFTAFVPSASQMQSVSNYLWNNAITDILDPNTGLGEKVDALKKIVANPYDAIMGCSIIPVTPPTAGSKELKMYGLLETGITLPYASSRWVKVDCGTLNIHEFWGGYLDYSPYTKTTSLYLPYIGTVSIDIDLIMAKALQVVYYVDILSGICVAFILVDGSVKFHYQGQCATQIPITNADYSSVISSGIGLIGNASQVVGSAVTGGVGGGVGGAVAGAVAGAISQAPSIASNVMGAKPDIRSGGAIGSSAGILSVQRPYLIIERPKQSVPAFQNHFTGYPSNITAKVSDLTGYTEFETINLDGLFLTDSEKKELEDILKGGVYL
jgi:hypothetical protein